MSTPFDWSKFDTFPESTCYCRCGAVFRSHGRAAMTPPPPHAVSRKPCPKCGKSDDITRIQSDPESMTLGREKS